MPDNPVLVGWCMLPRHIEGACRIGDHGFSLLGSTPSAVGHHAAVAIAPAPAGDIAGVTEVSAGVILAHHKVVVGSRFVESSYKEVF